MKYAFRLTGDESVTHHITKMAASKNEAEKLRAEISFLTGKCWVKGCMNDTELKGIHWEIFWNIHCHVFPHFSLWLSQTSWCTSVLTKKKLYCTGSKTLSRIFLPIHQTIPSHVCIFKLFIFIVVILLVCEKRALKEVNIFYCIASPGLKCPGKYTSKLSVRRTTDF